MTLNAGRAGLVDGGLCTRRAVMVWPLSRMGLDLKGSAQGPYYGRRGNFVYPSALIPTRVVSVGTLYTRWMHNRPGGGCAQGR
jgi:hypothetical protein